MPTYDYECDACHHKWELFQSIKAEPAKQCPECKKKKARRVIGPGAGILFKGSGFYITDYRSESYKKAASADKSSGDTPAAESSSGSTTTAAPASDKPASKPAKPKE